MKHFTFLLVFSFILLGCRESNSVLNGRIISLALSSDGAFALSCHVNHTLILWDIKNKKTTKIGENVNPYSLSFINHTDQFIWQSLVSHDVYLSYIDGKTQKRLSPGFRVYGHVFSQDLIHYYASDKDFALYHFLYNRKKIIKPAENAPSFLGVGKWLDLYLSSDERFLLTGAYGIDEDDRTLEENRENELLADAGHRMAYSHWAGMMLWDLKSGRALHQLGGNLAKTQGSLTPHADYVVAGDENGQVFIWDSAGGKKILTLDSLFYPNDKAVPLDFCDLRDKETCIQHERVNMIAFVGKQTYLRFTEGIPYVILYELNSSRPKRYFFLKGNSPDVFGFNGGLRIASSPKAKRFVLASRETNRILVYQFDKKEENLNLLWAPEHL
jgi:hypothetical protein